MKSVLNSTGQRPRIAFRSALVVAMALVGLAGAKPSATADPASPIVLEADYQRAIWTVDLDAGGKIGRFIVDLQSPQSGVSAGWAGVPTNGALSLELSSGGKAVATVPLFKNDYVLDESGTRAAGILGADVLARYRLGFDARFPRLTLWPRDGDAAESERWLGESPVAAPLDRLADGCPVVGATIRGKPVRLRLDSISGLATLNRRVGREGDLPTTSVRPRRLEAGPTQEFKRWISTEFQVGGVAMPWVSYTDPLDSDELADGHLPLFLYPTSKVLVDLGAKTMRVARLGEDDLLSRRLTDLVRLPLRVSGDGVTLGDASVYPSGSALKPYEGHPVLFLGESRAKDVLASLRGVGRLGTVQALDEMSRRGYDAYVQIEGENVARIVVKPQGPD